MCSIGSRQHVFVFLIGGIFCSWDGIITRYGNKFFNMWYPKSFMNCNTCGPQSLRCPLSYHQDSNIIAIMSRIIVNLMIYHELAYAFQLTFCLVSDTDFSKPLIFWTRFAIFDYLRSNGWTKTLLNSFCLHGFHYLW